MENQHNPKSEDINPVSRKTNEEIDEDESGNLIIAGKVSKSIRSDSIDGSHSEDSNTCINRIDNKEESDDD